MFWPDTRPSLYGHNKGEVTVMTRQHFYKVAHALADADYQARTAQLDGRTAMRYAIERMADALGGTNPNFDRDRFINAACGGATFEETRPSVYRSR
jgi:hypothetical protein